MYHFINEPTWFAKSLELIQKFYKIITLDELASQYLSGRIEKYTAVLTFDDGDISFYNLVLPILKVKQIPATLFVSPRKIIEQRNFWFQEIRDFNKDELKKIIADTIGVHEELIKNIGCVALLKCLKIGVIEEIISSYKLKFEIKNKECLLVNSDQLIDIDKSGLVTIGAHTMNHPILANENDETVKKEIVESISDLESLLGHQIDFFAYPNGLRGLDYSEREVDVLKSAGVRLSLTTNPGTVSPESSPHEIPRIGISYGSDFHLIAKIVLGKYWSLLKSKDNENTTRIIIDKILRQQHD